MEIIVSPPAGLLRTLSYLRRTATTRRKVQKKNNRRGNNILHA
jgi:hypothetical protein